MLIGIFNKVWILLCLKYIISNKCVLNKNSFKINIPSFEKAQLRKSKSWKNYIKTNNFLVGKEVLYKAIIPNFKTSIVYNSGIHGQDRKKECCSKED